jgi:hypothetical protein
MRASTAGVLLVLVGCAHAQPQAENAAAAPAEPVILPRSSIAAVLLHRGDLNLTDEQMQRLQARDEALDKAQADLRHAMAEKQKAGAKAPQASTDPPPPASPGMGGGRHGRQRSTSTEAKPKGESIEDQMNDNDTRAYLDAEADILTEKQKDAAREIAEKYREDLYDQREQAKRKANQ